MAVAEATPPPAIRSNALKLGLLGAISGAISWAVVNFAETLNIKFEYEGAGVMLLPVGVFPGVVFGLLFAIAQLLARHANPLRGLGYVLASTLAYLAAFHVAFYILGNIGHGDDGSIFTYVIAGVPAGFAGSALLGIFTRLLFPLRSWRLVARSVVVGTLAGALLVLGMYDDHNGWGFLAFFVLWQAAYGASLAPLMSNTQH
jgi:hypothetical protein